MGTIIFLKIPSPGGKECWENKIPQNKIQTSRLYHHKTELILARVKEQNKMLFYAL